MYMPQPSRGGLRTASGSRFSPSTTWDLGIELRSSGSAASTFGGLLTKPQLLLMQTDEEFWVLLLHFHRWLLLEDFILCGGLSKNGPTSSCI